MSYTYSENKVDLIINKVSRSIYKQLQENSEIDQNQIYVITDSTIDAANDKIINVADPVDETDASNKRYVDQQALSVLQEALKNGSSIYINGVKSDLSIRNFTEDEYHALTSEERAISNMLYVVEYENLNLYGEKITNVADPEQSSDAATKNYVDSEIANLSDEYQPKGNYLTSHQSLGNYYTKTQVNSISSYLSEQINSHESTPLTGKTYDLSQNGMFTKLVVDIGRALGATITNSPVDGLVAASIVDGDEMRFGN